MASSPLNIWGGVGLRQLLAEVVIARLNLFLQHFPTKSNLGKSLTISLQFMQRKAGTAGCPIGTPYKPYGPLTTPCWCRSFWEALDYFNFSIHLDYPTLQLPREKDILLIDFFKQHAGGDIGVLTSLQRCRITWNLLFFSDMVSADGRRIEPAFLAPPSSLNPPRSSFDFQEERPTRRDWATWAGFWARCTDVGHALFIPMGKWLAPSHRQWVWFYNSADNVIEYVTPASQAYARPTTNAVGAQICEGVDSGGGIHAFWRPLFCHYFR